MIYTPLTVKAMKIAYNAHEGQVDKSGVPYIFHPFHVAEQMNEEITVCIALLHDVMEDTGVTYEELNKEFPEEVTDALLLLTRREGEDYFDYVRKIRSNPYAKAVKAADIAHNSDETRITESGQVPEEKLLYWREKYAKAKAVLEGEIP